jgi:hypothetical protein
VDKADWEADMGGRGEADWVADMIGEIGMRVRRGAGRLTWGEGG